MMPPFDIIIFMENGIRIDNRQFYRTLLAIAVPIALQNLVSSSFTLVDNVMVGRLGELVITFFLQSGTPSLS